ncbi:hypothetical protein GCM10009535_22000 [Streptomyces thermocarboxydovorans]|uniref:Uncharacterized protein n=1 Tax=Streptomyces thermocarboxydovorans TaxID=59298 RepID=A0ABP3SJJ2_9ACTN
MVDGSLDAFAEVLRIDEDDQVGLEVCCAPRNVGRAPRGGYVFPEREPEREPACERAARRAAAPAGPP